MTLNKKVAIYVPSTKNSDNGKSASHFNNSDYVAIIAKFLSESFGGATAQDAFGYWMSPERGLESERVTIVYAYTRHLSRAKIQEIKAYCEMLKKELRQDAISLEINNKLMFI